MARLSFRSASRPVTALTAAIVSFGCLTSIPALPAFATQSSTTTSFSTSSHLGFSCAEAVYAERGKWTAGSPMTHALRGDAKKAKALGGIACQTTLRRHSTAIFSVARLSAAKLKSAEKAAAASGHSTKTLGGQRGYFDKRNHEAQVFAGHYWITVKSSKYSHAPQAAPLTTVILNVLPQG